MERVWTRKARGRSRSALTPTISAGAPPRDRDRAVVGPTRLETGGQKSRFRSRFVGLQWLASRKISLPVGGRTAPCVVLRSETGSSLRQRRNQVALHEIPPNTCKFPQFFLKANPSVYLVFIKYFNVLQEFDFRLISATFWPPSEHIPPDQSSTRRLPQPCAVLGAADRFRPARNDRQLDGLG